MHTRYRSGLAGLACILCGALAAAAAAQPVSPLVDPLSEVGFKTLQAGLEQTVEQHRHQATATLPVWSMDQAMALLSTARPEATRSPVSMAQEHLLEARRHKLAQDYGLTLRAGLLENIEQGVFDADGIFYKRRATLEVGWDVLQGGYLDNRLALTALDNDILAVRARAGQDAREEDYSRRFGLIIRTFNEAKIPLLQQRAALLDDLIALAGTLYRADYLEWDRLMKFTGQRAEVDVHLDNYRTYNHQIGVTPPPAFAAARLAGDPAAVPPVFVLDVDRMTELLDVALPQEVVDLELENLRLQGHPLRSMSLSPFVRYNMYHDPHGLNRALREYLSVGLSFSIKLPLRRAEHDVLVAATRDYRTAQREERVYNARKEVMTYYYEYEYKLWQYVSFYQKAERLRYQVGQALAERRLGDPRYNAVYTLGLLNDLIAVRIEIMDIQQQMYLKLLQMARLLQPGTLAAVLQPIASTSWLAPYTVPRAVYLWSSTFGRLDNGWLIDRLKRHQIGDVLLSVGPDDRLVGKAKAFIRAADAAGITVSRLVGSNALIDPDRRHRLPELAAEARAWGAQGLHLDVEPHTRDDWSERRAEYLAQYVQLLREARRHTQAAGLTLGISLPPHYGPAVVTDALALCDAVIVMAYGQTDPDRIRNTLDELVRLDPRRVRPALRPQDFPSVDHLEAFLEALTATPPYTNAVLHDLEGLLLLSEQPTLAHDEK